MDNITPSTNPGTSPDFLTNPNTNTGPENNSNTPGSNKKILVIIFIMILLIGAGATFYFLGGSKLFQGKISRINPQEASQKTSPKTTKEKKIATKAEKKSSTKNNEKTDSKNEEPVKEETTKTPSLETIFDEKTLNLSYTQKPTVKDSDKFVYFNTGKTSGLIGEHELKMPAYLQENLDQKKDEYKQEWILEACKKDLSKCIKIEKNTKLIFKKPPNDSYLYVYPKFGYDDLEKAVNELNLKHQDNISFRYKVTDPNGPQLISNVLTIQVLDDKAPPVLPNGETLLDKKTLQLSYDKISGGGGYEVKDNTMYFDIVQKSSIGFKIDVPSYDQNLIPNLKDGYLQNFKFKTCNEELSSCQTIKEDSFWIFSAQKKTEKKIYFPKISYEELKDLLKKYVVEYNNKFVFIFNLMDPTGQEIQSNTLEFIVSEEDQASLIAGPIEGILFDEKTFKILTPEEIAKAKETSNDKAPEDPSPYTFEKDTILYSQEKLSALKLVYQLPKLKPGETKSQYNAMVYLDYCNEDFSNCVEVSKLNATIFKKYPVNLDNPYPSYQIKETIIPDQKLDELVEKNPEKSYFRYRVNDPTGPEIFSNNYQVVTE